MHILKCLIAHSNTCTYFCKTFTGPAMQGDTPHTFEISKAEMLDRNTLRIKLKLFITDLLQYDFERLCALMYRHDVNEKAFNEALSLPNDEERSLAIAELVIARELQKMETRAAYAKAKNKDQLNP